jgi:hypothetical protein
MVGNGASISDLSCQGNGFVAKHPQIVFLCRFDIVRAAISLEWLRAHRITINYQ